MENDVIERETFIEAPIERVWNLLTTAEHLGRWFADAGAEIDLQPGGALTLRWSEHTVDGVVERVEPTSVFSFRWLQPSMDSATLVEFTLASDTGGTRLKVVESGFAGLKIPADERLSKFNSHVEGWKSEIGELQEMAESVATR